MRIVYQKGMFNIDNKNTDNSIYYSLVETPKGCADLSGMQCNHKEDSMKYKEIRQKCEAIYKQVKELEELL